MESRTQAAMHADATFFETGAGGAGGRLQNWARLHLVGREQYVDPPPQDCSKRC